MRQMIPGVSICMITHNRAHMIGAAIRSVLAQSYGDWELVIVDDGSTDATREVVRGFADSRIVFVPSPKQGEAAARSLSVQQARGMCIAFLDDDDRYAPTFLEEHMAVLERRPALVASYANFDNYSMQGEFLHTCRFAKLDRSFIAQLKYLFPMPWVTMVSRRDIVESCGPFHTPHRDGADAYFVATLFAKGLRQGIFHHIDKSLYHRVCHGNSINGRMDSQESSKVYTDLLSLYFSLFDKQELFPQIAWVDVSPRLWNDVFSLMKGKTYLFHFLKRYLHDIHPPKHLYERACDEFQRMNMDEGTLREATILWQVLRGPSQDDSPPFAVYGAGGHTDALWRLTEISQCRVDCVIDQKGEGDYRGRPIIALAGLMRRSVGGILLSSACHEKDMGEMVSHRYPEITLASLYHIEQPTEMLWTFKTALLR